MKIKISNEKIFSFLFALSALLMCFAPYQGDSTLSLSGSNIRFIIKIVQYIICFLILILTLISKNKKCIIKKNKILEIIPILIYFFMLVFNNYNGTVKVTGFLFMIQWIFFAISNDDTKILTFKYLKNFIFIISLLGIVCYLNYEFRFIIPFKELNYYSKNFISTYVDYNFIFLFKGYDANVSVQTMRLCGIFNEPGFFGTICALILCACNLNLKDKKNIVIFVAGLLTFSLAFALIIILFLILKYIKNIKTIIFVIFLILIYLFVLPNIKTGNANIDNLIQRMSITENGLAGDNRTKVQLDNIYKRTLETKPLFGYGNGYLSTQNTGGGNASYKICIIQYGVVGCLLIWGSLFIAAMYKNKNNLNVLFFVIVFFASIYQRPNIFNLLYQIILFGGISYLKKIPLKNHSVIKEEYNI